MSSLKLTCATCETELVARDHADAMQAGWSHSRFATAERGPWWCGSCGEGGQNVVPAQTEAAPEVERALSEAYDLETIERFARLLTDLREQGRIVPDLAQVGQCVVGALEAAVPAPLARGLGNAACGRIRALLNPQYR